MRSPRLLALLGDERLVQMVRDGNETAFEVIFDRHAPAILSFSRHMLGSADEAEDAVQQTFASAYRDIVRSDRSLALKPWLYAIARNRCLSMLRIRRAEPAELTEQGGPPLDEEIEGRADLRELLGDLRDLPEQQRAALVLSELNDLAHAQIADVLGCETQQVKGIVFRARSALAGRREGRHAPCVEIQEELATGGGGALRRGRVRYHLRECEACVAFGAEVRRQRSLMALSLPALPSAALKASVLGGTGIAASATGAVTAGSVGGLSGLVGLGSAGSGTLAKVALIAALATGAGVAGSELRSGESTRATTGPAQTVPQGATGAATREPARVVATGAASRGPARPAATRGLVGPAPAARQRGNARGGRRDPAAVGRQGGLDASPGLRRGRADRTGSNRPTRRAVGRTKERRPGRRGSAAPGRAAPPSAGVGPVAKPAPKGTARRRYRRAPAGARGQP